MWVQQLKKGEKKLKKKKQARPKPLPCQVPLTAVATCSPTRKPQGCWGSRQLALGASGDFTPRAGCVRGPRRAEGQAAQKVALHRSAEGRARIQEKFLPGEQPFFGTAQGSSPAPKRVRSKPPRNPGYPRAGAWTRSICTVSNASLKPSCLNA